MATEKKAKKAAKKESKAPAGKSPEPEPPKEVELIDLDQLAAELKLPAARIRQMIRGGQIRGVKVDGEWRFNLKLVQQTLGRRSRGR